MSNFVVRWSLFEVRGEVKPFFFRRAEHSYLKKKNKTNQLNKATSTTISRHVQNKKR